MLDLKFIRSDPDRVRRGLDAKQVAHQLDRILALDQERRTLVQEVETKKAERNQRSQEVPRLKSAGQDATGLLAEMKRLAEEIKEHDQRVKGVEQELERLLEWIPNLPHESVPVGPDASHNREVRAWGERRSAAARPRPHFEIAEELGLIDFRRAARLSGSGFAVFTGPGARLRSALIRFMLDRHVGAGDLEVSAPYLVRRECMFGTGQLPKMEEDMYRCEVDDLFLIPTAEVSITNLYREETLGDEQLPLRLVGYSPCFRREAGTYGKETRGLVRVHQFDKVEMVRITRPEDSYAELERLTAAAEGILQALELPYRVITLASGDLSFASAKTYDLEVWGPAEERWLEVSSCSNFEAFQARRIGLRFRAASGKLEHPHTLNGSGLALPRVLVALLEVHQTDEGSVRIPAALRPYLGGLEELRAGPGR
jgi:seryl-tRNA synthetase